MKHKYIAVEVLSGMEISSEDLPPILKLVRKHVKLPHGNKIRTMLLEEGVAHIPLQPDKVSGTMQEFNICIERWSEVKNTK